MDKKYMSFEISSKLKNELYEYAEKVTLTVEQVIRESIRQLIRVTQPDQKLNERK